MIEYFRDMMIFFPSRNLDWKQNKNSIIRFCVYLMIVIGFLTKNWNLVITLLVIAIIIEVSGSALIEKKIIFDAQKNYKPCRKSTVENPMANVLLYTDIDKMNQDVCHLQHDKIDKNLRYNVYYDSKDLFLKKQNLRSFITMPSDTHPNNFDQFKKYIYHLDNPTCKTDATNCMFNEDLRYHKSYFMAK